MSWEPHELWKCPEEYALMKRYMQRQRQMVHDMLDQDVINRYGEEILKLNMILQWDQHGRQGNRPCAHPDTSLMNRCAYELRRRGLPLPQVHLANDGTEGEGAH